MALDHRVQVPGPLPLGDIVLGRKTGRLRAMCFVTITTETRSGRQAHWFLLLIATLSVLSGLYWAFSFTFFAEDYLPFHVPSKWYRAAIVLVGVYCAVVGAMMPRWSIRGRWDLDKAGVRYVPLRGAVRTLAWHEVDAVWWGHDWIKFRQGTTVLAMFIQHETAQHREEARRFIRLMLPDFDLGDKSPERFTFKRLFQCVVIALPFAAASIATAFLQAKWLAGWRVPLFMWPVVFLLAVGMVMVLRQARRSWRLRDSGGNDTG